MQAQLDAGGQRDLELDLARRDGVAARGTVGADPATRPDLAGLLARHLAGLDHSADTGPQGDVFHARAAGRLGLTHKQPWCRRDNSGPSAISRDGMARAVSRLTWHNDAVLRAPMTHPLPVLQPGVLADGRKPAWLKVRAPGGPSYMRLRRLMRSLNLHSVC